MAKPDNASLISGRAFGSRLAIKTAMAPQSLYPFRRFNETPGFHRSDLSYFIVS
jgi:hypothetical protein